MRVKRTKRCKRLMTFYQRNFSFREPYQVIVDPLFAHTAILSKIHLQEFIPKLLTGSVKFMTTRCVLEELKRLGDEYYGAYIACRKYESIRSCKHDPSTTSSRECILSLLGKENKHRYIIAAMDNEFLKEIQKIPGTPSVHIYKGVLQLGQISESTKIVKEKRELLKLKPSSGEKKLIKALIGETKPSTKGLVPKIRRKIAKEPNPLSVKKKKKENTVKEEEKAQPKRKRRSKKTGSDEPANPMRPR